MKLYRSVVIVGLALLPVFALADEPLNCRVTSKFSSDGIISTAVVNVLAQAQSKVFLALYGFNNTALRDQLIKLSKGGVSVNLKVDAGKQGDKRTGAVIESLKAAGVAVQAIAADGRNHNKFAVIDGKLVITGSYNWTLRADRNWENVLFLECPELAAISHR